MVTTQYLSDKNNHLLFLLPGQSLSPRAFWDFELPDGTTHAINLFNSGIDIIMFDPVGYGNNLEFYQYNRIGYADQIEKVMSSVRNYDSRTILGFSTTTAPALIACDRGIFDKVIIHSPCIRTDNNYYVKHSAVFETGIEKLKTERLAKISDKLIPKPNRIDEWEHRILNVVGKREWKVPATVVYDINNYYPLNSNLGFNPDNIKNILSIIGQYDYEITTGGYETFKCLFPSCKEIIIPNSTHFSMWENEYKITLQAVEEYAKRTCL